MLGVWWLLGSLRVLVGYRVPATSFTIVLTNPFKIKECETGARNYGSQSLLFDTSTVPSG